MGFPGGSGVKNLSANAGDLGSSLGQEDPLEGGHENPLQYSAWEVPWGRSLAGYSPQGHKESDVT